MGAARVEIILEERDGGTEVTMKETPLEGLGKWVNNRLSEQILHRRNVEALARLTVMAVPQELLRPGRSRGHGVRCHGENR